MSAEQLTLLVENIQHFEYKWFWGLVYHKVQPSTNEGLLAKIESLRQNPASLQEMRKQQQFIDNKFSLIRFFYYVFNISDYVRNAYLLAFVDLFQAHCIAIKANKDLQTSAQDASEGNKGMLYSTEWAKNNISRLFSDNHKVVQSGNKSLFASKSPVPVVGDSPILAESPDQSPSPRHMENPGHLNFRPRTSPSPSPSPRRLYLQMPQDSESDDLESEFDRNAITIEDDHLLSHLATLGIKKEMGGKISCETIKRAFKRKILIYHPDKGLSSTDSSLFDRVKTARDEALRIISGVIEGSRCASESTAHVHEDLFKQVTKEAEHRTRKFQEEGQKCVNDASSDKSDEQIRTFFTEAGYSEEDIMLFLAERNAGQGQIVDCNI